MNSFTESPAVSGLIAEVTPGRWPVSTSEQRIQVRNVSGVPIPNTPPTAVIAAHCDGYCGRTSATMRTARSTSVTDIAIDLLLHSFGRPASVPWTGYGHTLSDRQAAEILAERPGPVSCAQGSLLTAEDRPILDALAEDGRTPQSKLAARTRWSVARVSRRLAALEACGALLYDVDVLPERLGYQLSAMLWLKLAPRDLDRVGERIAAHDHIAFAGAVSGTKNLMAIAICRDTDDLYRYLGEQLGQVDEIIGYEVDIRTQRLKQHGSLVAHGRLINPRPTRAAR